MTPRMSTWRCKPDQASPCRANAPIFTRFLRNAAMPTGQGRVLSNDSSVHQSNRRGVEVQIRNLVRVVSACTLETDYFLGLLIGTFFLF